MQTAAVALNLGADPLALLRLPQEDMAVMVAVLEVAAEKRAEELKALADYLAGEIAGRAVPPLAKTQWAAVKALARALSQR